MEIAHQHDPSRKLVLIKNLLLITNEEDRFYVLPIAIFSFA